MNTLFACSAGHPLPFVSFLFTTALPFAMFGLIVLVGLLFFAFGEIAHGERDRKSDTQPRSLP